MPARTHGLLTVIAATIAVALAIFAGTVQALWLGVAYALLSLVSLIAVVALYCTKCSDRDRCGHVIFGPVARLISREPRRGAYTSAELVLTSIALALIFALPQLWLWRVPLAFAGFWLFLLLSSIEIRSRVCPDCGNDACPLSRTG